MSSCSARRTIRSPLVLGSMPKPAGASTSMAAPNPGNSNSAPSFPQPGPTGSAGTPFFAINGHLREEVDFGGDISTQLGWLWRGNIGPGHAARPPLLQRQVEPVPNVQPVRTADRLGPVVRLLNCHSERSDEPSSLVGRSFASLRMTMNPRVPNMIRDSPCLRRLRPAAPAVKSLHATTIGRLSSFLAAVSPGLPHDRRRAAERPRACRRRFAHFVRDGEAASSERHSASNGQPPHSGSWPRHGRGDGPNHPRHATATIS